MGVDGVVVDPCALSLRKPAEVELANGDDRVTRSVLDRVAVHGELLIEGIVRSVALKLGEGRRNDIGVEHADLRRGLGVRTELARGGVGPRLVFALLHVVEAVGGESGVDVALNEGRFLLGCVRDHLEALDEVGNGRRDDEARHGRDGDSDDREFPQPLDRRKDEEAGDEHRSQRQDRDAGKGGVDVREGGAGKLFVVGQKHVVPAKPKESGHDKRRERSEHAEVDPDARGEDDL